MAKEWQGVEGGGDVMLESVAEPDWTGVLQEDLGDEVLEVEGEADGLGADSDFGVEGGDEDDGVSLGGGCCPSESFKTK